MSGRRRPRTQKKRLGKPRTLRARLVVASVVLIAVVCAVIGTVTTLALRSHLYEQLGTKVGEAAARASGVGAPPGKVGDNTPPTGNTNDLEMLVTRGPQQGSIAATVQKGLITDAKVGDDDHYNRTAVDLSEEAIEALNEVTQDEKLHTVDIPGLGEYLVKYTSGDKGSYYVALPTAEVNNTLNTLIAVEASVTAAGLIAAGIAGTVIVGVATRPCAESPRQRPGSPNSLCTPAR